MNVMTLQLYDCRQSQQITGVTSFVGEDASGYFGILPGHTCLMTILCFGLSRFRCGQDARWRYLAMPGAVLDFTDNTLSLACRHYLLEDDYARISQRLTDELLAEEEQLDDLRGNLKQLEEAMLKRLWELGHQGVRLR